MARGKLIKLLSSNKTYQGLPSQPTPDEKKYITAVEIASKYFHELQREEKTLRLKYTNADVIDGVWFALVAFFLKLPGRHFPAILSSELENLILYFYKAGQITGSINYEKATSQQINEHNKKIAVEIAHYRKLFGEKYPADLLRLIRHIHESKHVPVSKICKLISERTEWDVENIRQAYYRRYPRIVKSNQEKLNEKKNK